VVEVNAPELGLTRDQLVRILHAENVLARRYFHPGCHRMEPYRTLFPDAGRHLPVTEEVCARVLVLPTGTMVGEDAIGRTCAVLRLAADNAAVVRTRVENGG